VATNPDYPCHYCNLGEAYRGLGEFEKAAKAYREATRLNHWDPDAAFSHAMTLQEAGLSGAMPHDSPEAVSALEHALELAPGDADTLVALAAIRGREGDPIEERRLLEDAIESDPRHAVALVNLGCNHGDAGCALAFETEFYERAVGGDPMNKDAQYSLGCALARAGDLVRALGCFRTIVSSIDPEDGEAAAMAQRCGMMIAQQQQQQHTQGADSPRVGGNDVEDFEV